MIIRDQGKDYDVFLGDNGTLDTVINVNNKDIIFDGEFASDYRSKDGSFTDKNFRKIGIEAINAYEENYL